MCDLLQGRLSRAGIAPAGIAATFLGVTAHLRRASARPLAGNASERVAQATCSASVNNLAEPFESALAEPIHRYAHARAAFT